ncbi:MAG: BMP family ABC transporter substrate-binding protein [Synergistaceae bacterium]|nr:BMP family ABC transporter substrate-binding protein [Synergistaceae bacterium]
MSKRATLILAAILSVSALAFPAFADGLKVAIITSPNDVHDGGFCETNYNGLLAFQKDHPDASITAVQEKTGDPAECVRTAENIAADYDAVVCVGFQFAGIAEVAEDNPGTKFILVDTWPADEAGSTVTADNLYAMTFKEQEGGFLAGLAAALTTKSGKVAVVNGIAFPTNVNYQYGFMSGVNYANRHYGTKAAIVELPSYSGTDVTGKNVGGNYVGSFTDQANGKIVGQALIREGCDVIFVAAGASGMGVFTAAKEAKGVYIVGCDADQYSDGANGDSNIILTSALKVMDRNNQRVLNDIASGTFKGGNVLLGAESDSVGYVKTPGRHQLTDDSIAKIDAVYSLLKAGKIVPASFASGTTPDNFTGLDAE